jgi:hypothetical protein
MEGQICQNLKVSVGQKSSDNGVWKERKGWERSEKKWWERQWE